jgi:hypothetical protein
MGLELNPRMGTCNLFCIREVSWLSTAYHGQHKVACSLQNGGLIVHCVHNFHAVVLHLHQNCTRHEEGKATCYPVRWGKNSKEGVLTAPIPPRTFIQVKLSTQPAEVRSFSLISVNLGIFLVNFLKNAIKGFNLLEAFMHKNLTNLLRLFGSLGVC